MATGQSREALAMDDVYYKKKSSTAVKILGILFVLAAIAAIVLGVLYGLEVSKPPKSPTKPDGDSTTASQTMTPITATTPSDTQNEICETPACVSAASRILNAMDLTQDPCENFYEYACGIWNRDHIIPDDKSSVSTFNELREDVSKVLKRVLERDSTGERASVVKAKDFYSSCMNTSQIDSLGIVPVSELINEMGGWPVVDGTFNGTGLVFEELLATFRSRFGTSGIISSWVSADDKDSKANIIQLDQPSLGMPNREYYIDEDTRAKTEPGYRQYMTDLMTMIAGDMADPTRINTVVNEIVELETALAHAMAPDSERRDSVAIYRKRMLSELSTEIDDFDWTTYINKMLEVTEPLLTVDQNEEVVIYATDYLQNVSSIINGSMELVQNYLVWRVLKDRTSYMSAELRATRLPYTEATSGTTAESARWITCSDETNDNFPMPTSSLFVAEVFPEENKLVTEQMVEDLRAVFKEMLPDNEWMDQNTKDAAAEKADQINSIIAYPDYILDTNDPKMDEDYADVTVNSDEFFRSILELVVRNSKKSFGKLRDPVDFEEWITSPAIVNAFYSPSRNQIVFPAGILQPPFYDAGQPASMNYGAIGMVIGHEITHGFDDSGSQFDGYGNLNNWWSNSSRNNFEDRSRCMIDQYGAISWDVAGGENINGELTLGENIADNGGIRQAFGAYKKWQEANPEGDLRLPGLGDWTQDQLFFIGNAQVWCGIYTPEYALRLLKTDSHSPNLYRVMIPDQNFLEFGEAYNCKKGEDSMYPNEDDTCRVW